jgi:hypothetical protein
LFGASGQTENVKLAWDKPAPNQLWLSDLSEEPRQETGRSIEVPAWGIVTVRGE